jgi:hypothetical protein
MINDHIVQRRSGVERRKKPDRRSGFDRRNGVYPNGFDENGQEIVYTTKEACEYLKISRPTTSNISLKDALKPSKSAAAGEP